MMFKIIYWKWASYFEYGLLALVAFSPITTLKFKNSGIFVIITLRFLLGQQGSIQFIA